MLNCLILSDKLWLRIPVKKVTDFQDQISKNFKRVSDEIYDLIQEFI